MVNVDVLPFGSFCKPVDAVALSHRVPPNWPNAYLATPLLVGMVAPSWTSLSANEHDLVNVSLVFCV
jgi:hypothetical protein